MLFLSPCRLGPGASTLRIKWDHPPLVARETTALGPSPLTNRAGSPDYPAFRTRSLLHCDFAGSPHRRAVHFPAVGNVDSCWPCAQHFLAPGDKAKLIRCMSRAGCEIPIFISGSTFSLSRRKSRSPRAERPLRRRYRVLMNRSVETGEVRLSCGGHFQNGVGAHGWHNALQPKPAT